VSPRSRRIAGQELLLLARDPVPLVLLVVVPVVFIAVLKPAGFLALIVEGYVGTNGAEQAVPGAAVTFSLFATGLVGLSFFREHGWGTWARLRAAASPAEILAGKLLPLAGFVLAQLGLLFGLGMAGFGLHVRGPVLAIALFCLPVAGCVIALGLLLVGLARTLPQLNALANLTATLLAGVGGAVMPVRLLPGWARAVAPASPAYWSMRGFKAVILDGGGFGALLTPSAVLLAFTLAFLALAARLSFDEGKLAWG
jgi:ABC-2 type transport system permease protein